MRWFFYRSSEHAALLTLRARSESRWVSPPILCVSARSVRRNAPCGAKLYRLPAGLE